MLITGGGDCLDCKKAVLEILVDDVFEGPRQPGGGRHGDDLVDLAFRRKRLTSLDSCKSSSYSTVNSHDLGTLFGLRTHDLGVSFGLILATIGVFLISQVDPVRGLFLLAISRR
jgi:hypothetical protein